MKNLPVGDCLLWFTPFYKMWVLETGLNLLELPVFACNQTCCRYLLTPGLFICLAVSRSMADQSLLLCIEQLVFSDLKNSFHEKLTFVFFWNGLYFISILQTSQRYFIDHSGTVLQLLRIQILLQLCEIHLGKEQWSSMQKILQFFILRRSRLQFCFLLSYLGSDPNSSWSEK